MQKLEKFTERRSAFPECVGEWSTGSRQISPGEASQLREPETVGNICDIDDVGIGLAQRPADFLQPPQ